MITHLKVPRAANSFVTADFPVRACDPVSIVSNPKSLTKLPLAVTCKRCVLTRAFEAAMFNEPTSAEKLKYLREVRMTPEVVSSLESAWNGHDLGKVATLVHELDKALGISSSDWAGRDFDDN